MMAEYFDEILQPTGRFIIFTLQQKKEIEKELILAKKDLKEHMVLAENDFDLL